MPPKILKPKLHIQLTENPMRSWISIDGHRIGGVERLEIIASATEAPKVLLTIGIEGLEIDGDVIPQITVASYGTTRFDFLFDNEIEKEPDAT